MDDNSCINIFQTHYHKVFKWQVEVDEDILEHLEHTEIRVGLVGRCLIVSGEVLGLIPTQPTGGALLQHVLLSAPSGTGE